MGVKPLQRLEARHLTGHQAGHVGHPAGQVLLFAGGMVWVYKKRWEPVRNIIGGSSVVLLIAYIISEYVAPFNLVWVQWGLCVVVTFYLFYLSLRERHLSYLLIGLFAIGSIGFLYSSDFLSYSIASFLKKLYLYP